MGHRQPCVRALTRTVRVWKQDCGGRPWCAGYERRYVLCRRAQVAPCAVAVDSSAAAAAGKPAHCSLCVCRGESPSCWRWLQSGQGLGAEMRAGNSRRVPVLLPRLRAGTGDSPGKHLGPPEESR